MPSQDKDHTVRCYYCAKDFIAMECQPKAVAADSKSTNWGCLLVLFLLILIFGLILVGIFSRCSRGDYSNTENTKQEVVINSPWDGSVRQVEDYLKNEYLRDPDSLKIIESSQVVKTNIGYIVRCKFRAKNGFGGYNVQNMIFYLDSSGKVINCEEIP